WVMEHKFGQPKTTAESISLNFAHSNVEPDVHALGLSLEGCEPLLRQSVVAPGSTSRGVARLNPFIAAEKFFSRFLLLQEQLLATGRFFRRGEIFRQCRPSGRSLRRSSWRRT